MNEEKCEEHKIEKEIDLGGVMFCKICLDTGAKRINKFLRSMEKEDEE